MGGRGGARGRRGWALPRCRCEPEAAAVFFWFFSPNITSSPPGLSHLCPSIYHSLTQRLLFFLTLLAPSPLSRVSAPLLKCE